MRKSGFESANTNGHKLIDGKSANGRIEGKLEEKAILGEGSETSPSGAVQSKEICTKLIVVAPQRRVEDSFVEEVQSRSMGNTEDKEDFDTNLIDREMLGVYIRKYISMQRNDEDFQDT